MGAGFHGGFGSGTQGAKDNLIADLEKSGVKFAKEDVIFITKDATGQTV